jgi:hypothetical protein
MASYLRTITGSSSSDVNSNSPTNDLGKRIAKWALIIGVPTAVCVAAYLVYRQQQEQTKKSAPKRPSLPTPLNTTTTTDNRPKVIMKICFSVQRNRSFEYLESFNFSYGTKK